MALWGGNGFGRLKKMSSLCSLHLVWSGVPQEQVFFPVIWHFSFLFWFHLKVTDTEANKRVLKQHCEETN